MLPLTIRRIQNVEEKELSEIVEACVKSFESEPVIITMVGGNRELLPLLFSAMVRAGIYDGHFYVLEVDGRIVSHTLWFSPGHGLWKTEESRNMGFNELMEKIDAETRDWWTNVYKPAGVKFHQDHFKVPAKSLWWVNLLGTIPEQQRRGYATMLMKHLLNNVVESPAYSGLCSTNKDNEHFYNNLGYPTNGFIELPGRFGAIPVIGHVRQI